MFNAAAGQIVSKGLRLHPALRDAYAVHEVRYQSLFDPGRCLAFPCDAAGQVDPDALSAKALRNYRLAQAAVGRDFSTPKVVPSVG